LALLDSLHNFHHSDDDQNNGPKPAKAEYRGKDIAQQKQDPEHNKNQWTEHLSLLLLRPKQQSHTGCDQQRGPESPEAME
jgi:hypothetical protein